MKIEDSNVVVALGKTHHANAAYDGNDDSRVVGMAFEITDAELAGVDAYELPFSYERVVAALASGRQAWVYVHTPRAPRNA